jgi:hypothetical protein
MPFAVMFLPTDASPPRAMAQAQMREVAAAAGPIGPDGTVRPAGQPVFTLYDGDIYLRSLSPLTCRVIFDAARQTNSIIVTAGRSGPYLMMKGSSGKLIDDGDPDPGPPIKPVVAPDAPALCLRLGRALRDWNHDTARDRKDGVLDANDQPILPPPDPGTATRIAGDPSGVAARCADTMGHTLPPGWKVVRTLVTQDPRWGVVWRADVATDDPSSLFRETCWTRTARTSGLSTSTQPLEMFDPKRSVPPLPAR